MERALAQADQAPGLRLEQLTARAWGLLTDPTDAEAYFGKACPSPPVRPGRSSGPNCARLGVVPWTRRAEVELRACGVTTQAAPTVLGALAELTAQQREIVILASRGPTNGVIADQLFLSPAPSPPTCTAPTPSSVSPAATSSATSSDQADEQPAQHPATDE
jgi:hypothetical protein